MENIEIWKDITEYKGLYQISNFGRVKSLERVVIFKDGRKKTIPERILKQGKCKNGYLLVCLWKNNKVKYFTVHKLVALTFLENDNPTEKTQVNHLDENKENNHVSNLKWVTPKENNNYGTRNERASKTMKGRIAPNRKPILQFTKDGVFIRYWDSALSASTELNLYATSITKCCKGKQNQCGGYKWVYKSDYIPTNTQLELNFD